MVRISKIYSKDGKVISEAEKRKEIPLKKTVETKEAAK